VKGCPSLTVRTLAEGQASLDALAAHEPEVARPWATVHIAGLPRGRGAQAIRDVYAAAVTIERAR
jgi:hypothetical protein